jgi:hypothetical protein
VFAFQVAEAVPEPEPADQPTPQNNPARRVRKILYLRNENIVLKNLKNLKSRL